MTFKFQKKIGNSFSLNFIGEISEKNKKIIFLLDKKINQEQEKLLENLLKIAPVVQLIIPEQTLDWNVDHNEILEISSMVSTNIYLIAEGRFAPILIEYYNMFRSAKKVVFINPRFKDQISTKMAAFETPSLVVTATPGNLDHDPDAVKYHDLISGSSIQYVRGVEGNPLFTKFTQSFNSIQRFLVDD